MRRFMLNACCVAVMLTALIARLQGQAAKPIAQPNDVVVEFEKDGMRRIVAQPGDVIVWMDEDGSQPQVTFPVQGSPCATLVAGESSTGGPPDLICTIGSSTGVFPYTFSGCGSACRHAIRVRSGPDSSGDENYRTGGAAIELPASGGEMHLEARPDDTVHFRHKSKQPLTVQFQQKGDTVDPCGAGTGPAGNLHMDCKVAQGTAYGRYHYALCDDDGSNCQDPTLHVVGSTPPPSVVVPQVPSNPTPMILIVTALVVVLLLGVIILRRRRRPRPA